MYMSAYKAKLLKSTKLTLETNTWAIEFIPLHDILHVAKFCFELTCKRIPKPSLTAMTFGKKMPAKREDGLPRTDPREREFLKHALRMLYANATVGQ